jgi:hypothetical protein
MKHPNLLKRFEYSVPGSDTATSVTDSRDIHPIEMNSPLLKVNIDFEKRSLSVEGNGQTLIGSAGKPKRIRSASDKERVIVKASIYPGLTVDLSAFTGNELVFSLEGILDNGESIHSCSGLLVLDSATERQLSGGREWHLTLYIYDDYNDEQEIKLKLMMCSLSENAQLN